MTFTVTADWGISNLTGDVAFHPSPSGAITEAKIVGGVLQYNGSNGVPLTSTNVTSYVVSFSNVQKGIYSGTIASVGCPVFSDGQTVDLVAMTSTHLAPSFPWPPEPRSNTQLSILSAQIADATSTGRQLIDVADANTARALLGAEPVIPVGTLSQYWRGDKTFQNLDKTAVGLSLVDNTADVNKPISTATQTALDGKEPSITAGTTAQYWRGDKSFQTLDKTAVGLANVDNTADANKNVLSASKLTTAHNIDGQAFDGTADITVIAPGTHAATAKTTPVAADELALVDSAASNTLKKLTWANLQSAISAQTVFNVKDPAYGAVGDGVTDDSAAIQAAIDAAQVGGYNGGGIVYFPSGHYNLGSTLLVKESNVTLQGAGIGASRLLVTSASATYPAITFTGYVNGVAATLSDNSTYAWNFQVRDLWIEKGTPVANLTAAISTSGIQFARFHNVHIRGFGTGITCTASFNVYAHQVHIQSNSAATTSTLYGWKFDSTHGNYSSYLSHCTVGFGGENIDPGAGAVVTSYAYYHDGAHPSDWFLDHCEGDVCTYGFYYNGSAAAAYSDVMDIHFVACVADQAQYGFTILNNLTPSTTGGQVDLTSCYWANRFTSVVPTPNSIGISVGNCSGVTIRGFMGFSGNPSDPTHYQNNYGVLVNSNSRDVTITGCNLKGNFVQGIYLNSAQFVSIFGNTALQTASIGGNAILLVGSSNVSIAGNTMRSVAGLTTPMASAVYVDGTSTNVVIENNIVDTATVTAPLTVASGGVVTRSRNIGIAEGSATAYVATAETTTSASYTDLATTTDQVTVIIGPSGTAQVSIHASIKNDTAAQWSGASFAISGANTLAASDKYSIWFQSASASQGVYTSGSFLLTGLTPGSTTFKIKYMVTSGTGTFQHRHISVIPQ